MKRCLSSTQKSGSLGRCACDVPAFNLVARCLISLNCVASLGREVHPPADRQRTPFPISLFVAFGLPAINANALP